MPRAGFHVTSTMSGAKAGLPPQGSDSVKPPTSSKLLKPRQEPSGCGAMARTLKKDSQSSAAGQLAKETHKAKSNSSSFCTSQGRDSGTHLPTGPGTKLAVPKDSDLAVSKGCGTATVKPSPLGRAALEQSSTTAPLLAKNPVLSAKKVSELLPRDSSWHLVPSKHIVWGCCQAPAGQGWVGRVPQLLTQGCGSCSPSSLGQGVGPGPAVVHILSDPGDGCCPLAWDRGVTVPVPAVRGALAPSWGCLSPEAIARE